MMPSDVRELRQIEEENAELKRLVKAPRPNGRKFRMLHVIDEFTRECIAIRIDRKLKSTDVMDVSSVLFILRGVPVHVRPDNGP